MKKISLILAMTFCLALPSFGAAENIKMATTTSTQDSGLLDYLAPIFKTETGHELQWVSVGSGQALKHGESCDVDVLLVHSPAAEEKFVAAGSGIDRRQVMYNDYIIVGPAADPAKIKGNSASDALTKIATTKSPFASRGDESGTHSAEKTLWTKTGQTIPEKDSWYLSVGQGMMNTLALAAEKNAYTLADRGTYIKYAAANGGNPPLVILTEGDPLLFNQYSVMLVNPEKCPTTKVKAGNDFLNWWVNPSTQEKIASYTLEGKQLFFPNASK